MGWEGNFCRVILKHGKGRNNSPEMHPGEETMLCYTEAWEIEGACFNRAVCNIGIIMAIKFSENYYQKHRILAFKTVDIKEPIHSSLFKWWKYKTSSCT